MVIRNFTPHAITLICDGEKTTFESEGAIRLEEKITETPKIGGFETIRKEYVGALGLPETKADVFIIVSGIVLSALGGSRKDLISPDTGPDSAIRNEKGHIIGVKRFLRM